MRSQQEPLLTRVLPMIRSKLAEAGIPSKIFAAEGQGPRVTVLGLGNFRSAEQMDIQMPSEL